MALSATIALSQAGTVISTVPREQKFRATVTVSNSGGSPISLDEITPSAKNTSQAFADQMASAALGTCRIDSSNPVPAGGSAIYVFDVSIHAPSNPSISTHTPTTYDVDCVIYGDGEVVQPTPATITVTAS